MEKIMGIKDACNMFGDVWKLYKKYIARRLDEGELAVLACEAEAVYQKYKTPFAREVVLAALNEIDRAVKYLGSVGKG